MEHKDKRELYKILRSQVEHEDNLVNQRVTWLLLIQGFLFASFYNILISTLDKPDYFELKLFLLIIISAFGISISWKSLKSIIGAFQALEHIRDFWFYKNPQEGLAQKDNLFLSNFPDKEFPDITYRGDSQNLSAGVASKGIPQILIGIWSIIIIGLFIFWYYKSSRDIFQSTQKNLDLLKMKVDSLIHKVDKIENQGSFL